MFHEVRVYNSQEELKNIISPETLSKRHWKNYWEADNKLRLPSATHSNIFSIFLRVKKANLEFYEQKDEVFV